MNVVNQGEAVADDDGVASIPVSSDEKESQMATELSQGDLEVIKIHAHNGAQAQTDRRIVTLDHSDKNYMLARSTASASGFRILSESGSGKARDVG